MIYLSNEDSAFLKEFFPFLKVRDDKVIFNGEFKGTIPSKMFPLLNKRTIKLFTAENTEELEDEKVKEIFDAFDFQLGKCYNNTRKLVEKLAENGITDVKAYVGWMIVVDAPLHHCWAVYKDKYILDGSVDKTLLSVGEYFTKNNITDINEQRKIMAQRIRENKTKKNSEIKTLGEAYPLYAYLGTETDPVEGLKLFKELVGKYPNHPAYVADGQNAHGASKVQQMVLDNK